MERILVSSSNLRSVGYDEDTEILEIQFHHGGIYQYQRVPQEVYDQLMAASSKGSYFDRVIKKNPLRYPCRKINL